MRYLAGIGTYYGFDDSIGLRVAEAVSEAGLDCGFRVLDLGGNVLDLVHHLGSDTRSVLVVDAARMGLAPGEFALFAPEQAATRKELAGVSTHEGDLMRVLALAEVHSGRRPPVTVLGIEPAEIRAELGLSPELERRFDEYVCAAVAFFGDSAAC